MIFPREQAISSAQEEDWARRLAGGDDQARETLVKSQLFLAFSIAWKLRHLGRRWGVELDDLIGAGLLGLVKAVDAFEPQRGFRLVTFAKPFVRGYILRAICTGSGPIRVSHHRFWNKKPQPGSARTDQARLVQAMKRHDLSEVVEVRPGDSPEENVSRSEIFAILRDAVDGLPDQEARVVRLYFGLDDRGPLSMRQIAQAEGVVHTTVQNWIGRAKTTLAQRLASRGIAS